jgi:hypothetical protein
MKTSKLITLLKTFTGEEIKQFDKFLSSSFFSRGRNLNPYFRILNKYYPTFDAASFNEKNIFERLYPGKKFSGKSSLHLIHVKSSELFSMAEKFLVYSGFEKGRFDYEFNKCLGKSYIDKKLLEQALKKFLSNSMIIDKGEKDLDFHFRKLETDIALISCYYFLSQPQKVYEKSSNELLYIYAFIFYIMVGHLNQNAVFKRRYNQEFKGVELIIQFIETFDPELFEDVCVEDSFETKNLILIYYYILKSRFSEDVLQCLTAAEDIYRRIFSKLSQSTQWDIFIILYNRLFGSIGSDINYLAKANDLIDFVWSNEVFSHNKKLKLDFRGFLSALSIKFSLLDADSFRMFIEQYSGKVDVKYIESIRNYSNALLCFKERSFDKCLQNLSKKDLLETVSDNDKYKLRICCFYEMNYTEDLYLAFDSFDHFLRNNRTISENLRTESQAFLNCIKALLRLKQNKTNRSAPAMTEIMDITRNTLLGFWFKEKIQEIER